MQCVLERVCVCVCARASVRACKCVCARERVPVNVHARVCIPCTDTPAPHVALHCHHRPVSFHRLKAGTITVRVACYEN